MANSVDPDQTALLRAVCSGSTLFDSVHNLSADDIFICIFSRRFKAQSTKYFHSHRSSLHLNEFLVFLFLQSSPIAEDDSIYEPCHVISNMWHSDKCRLR